MAKISVVVPSKGCKYIEYLFTGLRGQIRKPDEVILVLKECNITAIEKLCEIYSLKCIIIEQKQGYFTHALNIGKREATGDIIIFTDDDVIPPKKWVHKYFVLHKKLSKIAGICSRDIYIDLNQSRILPTPDDAPIIKLYRWFIRPWKELPHPLLRKYRLGVYITKKLDIAHGPFIPYKMCYSLPFRGVNMSFKHEYIYNIWFPEHSRLIRAVGNEQYFGLQLVLNGFDIIFTPINPVLHIFRESLSRTHNQEQSIQIEYEMNIMRGLYAELLSRKK